MQVKHGWLQFGQLDGRNAHCPNITEMIVTAFSLDSRHFWSHPVGSTDKGLAFTQRGGNLSRDPKVGQFDFTAIRQENVGSFDVSMHYSLVVKVSQPLQHLSNLKSYQVFLAII